MKLTDLGYNEKFEKGRADNALESFGVGRVIAEHKERYTLMTTDGEVDAEITGNLRFTANSREDFPAVGDWVAITLYDSGFAVIHSILPRTSLIKRQAIHETAEVQVIAANIDVAFLVQAVDRDFNINRLERYLTICHTARVDPVIVLTKTDLIDEPRRMEILEHIRGRIRNVPVVALSNQTRRGYEMLEKMLEKGKTYCMLGSSGVGKSTLLNNLSGKAIMKTDAISHSTNKGRHVTSHRELTILDNGALLIDNPGMREVGIVDDAGGLEDTFDNLVSIARHCRFRDCTHTSEAGCSVLEALEKGEIDPKSYENYMKMQRERAFYESSLAERRKKDKDFGKMLKNYKKTPPMAGSLGD